jgi:hypothetical protein
MNSEKLTIKVEIITPESAAGYLAKNDRNRRQKETTLDAYARDMLAGKWRLTHQGIAFDDKGNLIDGQHRLGAVLRAKVPVEMLVMRGFPSKADKDGIQLIEAQNGKDMMAYCVAQMGVLLQEIRRDAGTLSQGSIITGD